MTHEIGHALGIKNDYKHDRRGQYSLRRARNGEVCSRVNGFMDKEGGSFCVASQTFAYRNFEGQKY